MTDPASLKEIVLSFIAGSDLVAAQELRQATDDFNFLEAGYMDSSGFVDLMNHLEEKTGIIADLAEADPTELGTLKGLTRYYCSARA